MKIAILFFVTVFFLSSCGEAKKEGTAETTTSVLAVRIANLSASDFENQFKADANAIILDVRTPGETQRGTMEGVQIVDFNRADFEAQIDKLDKNKAYYIYCAGGVRSGQTCKMMKKKGFTKLYNLANGYGDWKQWKNK